MSLNLSPAETVLDNPTEEAVIAYAGSVDLDVRKQANGRYPGLLAQAASRHVPKWP